MLWQVKLQSQPRPAPGQLPQFSGALDATKQVRHNLQRAEPICMVICRRDLPVSTHHYLYISLPLWRFHLSWIGNSFYLRNITAEKGDYEGLSSSQKNEVDLKGPAAIKCSVVACADLAA